MRHTLLLFDIDGTLVTTSGAGVRAMKTVGNRLFGRQFSFAKVTFGGGLDPLLFAEAASLSGLCAAELDEQAFREAYLLELEAELARIGTGAGPMPGIASLLEHLRNISTDTPADGTVDASTDTPANGTGPMLGLLTGNYTRAVPIKLTAAGIDHRWFPITAFGDEAATRPDLTALAMNRYAAHAGEPADPDRVVIIGDTPRDVHCAKAHGCVAFAVATGTYSEHELAQAGADVVVADLSDPAPLLGLMERS